MSPEKQVTQEQYDQFDNRMLEQVETNITEKAQEMEKTLNQKIKETKARNEQLAQKISLFRTGWLNWNNYWKRRGKGINLFPFVSMIFACIWSMW